VFAVTIGALPIIPPFISIWSTWGRVREATESTKMSAGKQFVFCFVPLINIAYMGILQHRLNSANEAEFICGSVVRPSYGAASEPTG
jgi:hypothetical protein